jgi:hypothetical protein
LPVSGCRHWLARIQARLNAGSKLCYAISPSARSRLRLVLDFATMAELAVKLRRLAGLGVSRVSDHIQPPAEIIAELMAHPKGR